MRVSLLGIVDRSPTTHNEANYIAYNTKMLNITLTFNNTDVNSVPNIVATISVPETPR